MRVLVDICHPAHVHFFRHPIRLLHAAGDQVLVTSRGKECAIDLLMELGIKHRCLGESHRGGLAEMVKELVVRNRRLIRLCREFRPDILTGVGGTFVAQSGRWLGLPSVVFYDTEHAHLQNALTYPFANRLVVPDCYTGRTPASKTVRYAGYHELSYLHPDVFTPDRQRATRAMTWVMLDGRASG